MAPASIPVDLFNPGQVFACMGFLEAAEVLLGQAEGGFDWDEKPVARFELRAGGAENPIEDVLEFLIKAELERLAPNASMDPPASEATDSADAVPLCVVETFPAPRADRMALPLRLGHGGRFLDLTHWCDASSRKPFKLFTGQQRSAAIARQMLDELKEALERP